MLESRRASFGFTLTEYLAVMTIIIVLGAIGTAVFVQAKRAAYVTNCQSNLRQISQALHLYSSDFDGWAPVYVTKKRGNDEGVTAPANPKLWRDSLNLYSKNTEIFYCPRDPFRSKFGLNFDSTFTSYEAPLAGLGATYVSPGYYQMNVPLAANEPNPYVCDQTWPDLLHQRPQWFLSVHGEQGNYAFLNGSVKYVHINTGQP